MSQRDNFSGGFLLGVALGGLVGGIVGSVLTARRFEEAMSEEPVSDPNLAEARASRAKERSLNSTNEKEIEMARRSLEDKIAQLNDAIDDVRQQLGNVNGNRSDFEGERSLSQEN
jgi:esterase/lipase